MKYKGFFLIFLIFAGISYYYSREDWLGFYYPGGCLECYEQYIYSPPFRTKMECLDWGYAMKTSRGNPKDEFECGKNCKTPSSQNDFYVCKETVDS